MTFSVLEIPLGQGLYTVFAPDGIAVKAGLVESEANSLAKLLNDFFSNEFQLWELQLDIKSSDEIESQSINALEIQAMMNELTKFLIEEAEEKSAEFESFIQRNIVQLRKIQEMCEQIVPQKKYTPLRPGGF